MHSIRPLTLYRLAAGTGFRAKELRSLKPASFKLDDDGPTVTVDAAHSKHRRTNVQPIRQDLAEQLHHWLVDKPASRRVFEHMPRKTARILRPDLQAARDAWIEAAETVKERAAGEKSEFLLYRSAAGEVFDFSQLSAWLHFDCRCRGGIGQNSSRAGTA